VKEAEVPLKVIYFLKYFVDLRTITIKVSYKEQQLQFFKSSNPYTLEGFEPTIFCSIGGNDDHTTPPRNAVFFLYCA
jgi:hypothetical protein